MNSEEGFDHRCAREGLWGFGSYFAESAAYSNAYAYQTGPQRPPHKQMLLARVLLGDCIELPQDRTLRRPPRKTAATVAARSRGPSCGAPDDGMVFQNARYDSVSGKIGGTRIYIVYENGRAVPEYLVTYA
eukprot:SAG31_NODE_2476_length_5639_cov_8.703069_5_plen_131_part_00